MGSLYFNSYLTIAADRASADVEGFLTPREMPYFHMNVITLSGESVRIGLQTGEIGNKIFKATLGKEPLHRRAWALQERYMSKRTLHFTTYRAAWSCLQGEERETGRGSFKSVKVADLYPSSGPGRKYQSYFNWYVCASQAKFLFKICL